MAEPFTIDALQEIDLLLAAQLADGGEPAERTFERQTAERPAHISGVLRFLGIAANPDDVAAALRGSPSRFPPGTPEAGLVDGLRAALDLVEARSASGATPDGDFVLALWRRLSARLPGPRRPHTRVSRPADGLPWVSYPPPSSLPGLLARFGEDEAFLDFPALFRSLHPVQQSFRVFHRLARIAPFDDHNTVIAWLAATEFLLARGYPHLRLHESDAPAVRQLLMTGPPKRFAPWEQRVLPRSAPWRPRPRGSLRRRRPRVSAARSVRPAHPTGTPGRTWTRAVSGRRGPPGVRCPPPRPRFRGSRPHA